MDIESSLVLNVMKYFIAAVGLLMAYAEMRQALRLKNVPYAWVKWGLGIMGIYWAFYYTMSIVGSPLASHQIWVRSPLLLTLSLITAGAILSLKRGR